MLQSTNREIDKNYVHNRIDCKTTVVSFSHTRTLMHENNVFDQRLINMCIHNVSIIDIPNKFCSCLPFFEMKQKLTFDAIFPVTC